MNNLFKKKEKFDNYDKEENYMLGTIFRHILILILIIWILLSIAALIMSVYCFKYGVTRDSITGLILAFVPIFLGPLYWIYYIWNPRYCTYIDNQVVF